MTDQNKKIKISVIICSYNREAMLARLLD